MSIMKSGKMNVELNKEAESKPNLTQGHYINRNYPQLFLKERVLAEYDFIIEKTKELLKQIDIIVEYMETVSVIDVVDRLNIENPDMWLEKVQKIREDFKEENKSLINQIKTLLHRVQYSGFIDKEMAFTELDESLPILEKIILHYTPLLEMHVAKNAPEMEITRSQRLQ